MKKRFVLFCVLALSMSLLTGCMPGVVVTSPKDEEFQKDWNESMEELEEDWRDALDEIQNAWDNRDGENAGKDHY